MAADSLMMDQKPFLFGGHQKDFFDQLHVWDGQRILRFLLPFVSSADTLDGERKHKYSYYTWR